jgi:hypothetical protein
MITTDNVRRCATRLMRGVAAHDIPAGTRPGAAMRHPLPQNGERLSFEALTGSFGAVSPP